PQRIAGAFSARDLHLGRVRREGIAPCPQRKLSSAPEEGLETRAVSHRIVGHRIVSRDSRRLWQRACARLWLARIRVLGREHVPASGPILYLGLHRNGAVDGFVCGSALPDPTFMVAARWTRNPFMRLFVDGIA